MSQPCARTEETPLEVDRMRCTVISHFQPPSPTVQLDTEGRLYRALKRFAEPEPHHD